jgi:hypothetical protein
VRGHARCVVSFNLRLPVEDEHVGPAFHWD